MQAEEEARRRAEEARLAEEAARKKVHFIVHDYIMKRCTHIPSDCRLYIILWLDSILKADEEEALRLRLAAEAAEAQRILDEEQARLKVSIPRFMWQYPLNYQCIPSITCMQALEDARLKELDLERQRAAEEARRKACAPPHHRSVKFNTFQFTLFPGR